MNLGGPDSLQAVQPFLVNLFSDPAIIDLPWFLRLPLARFVASRRGPLEIARADGDDVQAIARIGVEMRGADAARADKRNRLFTVARRRRAGL